MGIETVETLEENEGNRFVVLGDGMRFQVAGHGNKIQGATIQPGQRCVVGRRLVFGGMEIHHEDRGISREIRPVDALAFKGALDPEAIFLNKHFIDVKGKDTRVVKEHGTSFLEFGYDGGYCKARIQIPDFDRKKFGLRRIRVFGVGLQPDEVWKMGTVHGAVLMEKDPECIFYEPLEQWHDRPEQTH